MTNKIWDLSFQAQQLTLGYFSYWRLELHGSQLPFYLNISFYWALCLSKTFCKFKLMTSVSEEHWIHMVCSDSNKYKLYLNHQSFNFQTIENMDCVISRPYTCLTIINIIKLRCLTHLKLEYRVFTVLEGWISILYLPCWRRRRRRRRRRWMQTQKLVVN